MKTVVFLFIKYSKIFKKICQNFKGQCSMNIDKDMIDSYFSGGKEIRDFIFGIENFDIETNLMGTFIY